MFSCLDDNENIPTVELGNITNITATSATSNSEVISDGGFPVTSRGVCWSTSKNPTTDDNTTNDGSGTGSFTSYITGLTTGETYYLRAYAINDYGTGYSTQSVINVTALLPTVSYTIGIGGTSTTISVRSYVTNDGGAEIIAKGFCWALNPSPTINNNKTWMKLKLLK